MFFSEFMESYTYIIKREGEEKKRGLIEASFIAWQMGVGNKKSFGEYLKSLGLSEDKPEPIKDKKKYVKRALYIAERAMKHDKKRVKR